MAVINISHGAGGRLMHELIDGVFFKYLGNEILNRADDSARLSLGGRDIAFTTDSFVVKPLFFPGGDIGKLAVCGTVNDLAVSGADPKYISCGFIIEEGLDESVLVKVVESMAFWAKQAGVRIVTGDTKVVERQEADGLFINTSGIGILKPGLGLKREGISIGDKIITTGSLGDHGIAVLSKRKGLEFESRIESDCAPLNKMISRLLDNTDGVRFMRDPTRGGVSAALNEITQNSNFGILLNEESMPVSESVRAACELLGLDPLYIANEGKALLVAAPSCEEEALKLLRQDEYGRNAATIGEVTAANVNRVCLRTRYGVTRILDMASGEPIPRIC